MRSVRTLLGPTAVAAAMAGTLLLPTCAYHGVGPVSPVGVVDAGPGTKPGSERNAAARHIDIIGDYSLK